ncbi:MAG: STAS domain-containing protein [Myxococcaceae bacterium]
MATELEAGLFPSREWAQVQTVTLDGELTSSVLYDLQEELFRLAHRGQFHVVLDFSNVSHVDYRGVRPLISRAELFRRAGGDVKLASLSSYLQAIFRAAGAHSAFELYDSPHEAALAFAPPADR